MNDWEKSLNINERFDWATEEQKEQILAEIKFQREQAYEMCINLQHPKPSKTTQKNRVKLIERLTANKKINPKKKHSWM